jgi:hypothetical protein
MFSQSLNTWETIPGWSEWQTLHQSSIWTPRKTRYAWIWLPDNGISYQHYLEQIVVLITRLCASISLRTLLACGRLLPTFTNPLQTTTHLLHQNAWYLQHRYTKGVQLASSPYQNPHLRHESNPTHPHAAIITKQPITWPRQSRILLDPSRRYSQPNTQHTTSPALTNLEGSEQNLPWWRSKPSCTPNPESQP